MTEYSAAWYDYSNSEVCLKYWVDSDIFDVHTVPFKWYFYIDVEEYSKGRTREIDRLFDDLVLCDSDRYYKAYIDRRDRYEVAPILYEHGIVPREIDIDPATRYIVDNGIDFAKQRILFFDLETDSRYGFIYKGNKSMPNPEAKILSVAWQLYGFDEKVQYAVADTLNEEGDLVEYFLEDVMSKADTIVAWNLDGFDQPVLENRAKKNGITVHWNRINSLDMLKLFRHGYYGFGRDSSADGVKTSFKLNDIAQKLLGWGKTGDVHGSKIYEVWQTDRDRLRRYNKRDVEIMIALEEARRYIRSFEVACNLCNRFPTSLCVDVSSWMNNGFILRYGKQKHFHIPPKLAFREDEKIEGKYKGAHVVEPVKGVHENIHVLDFASLYPSIIRAFNISFEMHNRPGKKIAIAANDAEFCNDEVGFIPSVIEQTVLNRSPCKKVLQELKKDTPEYFEMFAQSNSWKVIGNSFYGLTGSQHSNIYKRECAEAVTLTGQAIMKEVVIKNANKLGYLVVAGDTDSVFLKCTKEQAKEFVGICDRQVDQWVKKRGGNTGIVRFEFEDSFDRIFWVAKKHYAGRKSGVKKGKIYLKGLAPVKSDSCQFVRTKVKELLQMLLWEEWKVDDLIKWVLKMHDETIEGLSVEDIMKSQEISRSLDKYKVETAHVRVAKKMLENGQGVRPGDKIPYFVIEKPKNKPMIVRHVDEFDGTYDGKYYWTNVMYRPVKTILTAVFPDYEYVWNRLNDPYKEKFSTTTEYDSVFVDCEIPENRQKRFEKAVKAFPGTAKLFVNGEQHEKTVFSCQELVDMLNRVLGGNYAKAEK